MTPLEDSTKLAYGEHPDQFGELSRPTVAPRRGTVVVIHGGFWRAAYDCSLGRPLAADLATRGWTVWNLEYRRVGAGGGWPTTLADVAAGIDHLVTLDVDTSAVVTVGHSAGGHLAAWAAARPLLPPEAPGALPRVAVTGVVSQAGVLCVRDAALESVGERAAPDLLGGTPDEVPERYQVADPSTLLPLGVPVRCVHGRRDAHVPFWQSTRYVEQAVAAGDDARLVEVGGDHFTLINPAHGDWRAAVDCVAELAG